ncbi:DUF5815 family protein [Halocatena pleomorpha]|uniref:Uncharacterized protein n=1 Tax=Halocatena pleomorpha TaxID=1785090 RepID=A0A3P3RFM5_9EURY|nr:DUF5815 family protein [Halocatena pleomorpha]RRJ32175.1 hypothetical protein EIK79_05250 [Halocatena pleomorpha]
MAEPRVPGGTASELSLPCGESIDYHDLDMGLREIACACGQSHAVVMDVHPLSRFVPEDLVTILNDVVETTDGAPFGTMHIMGMVMEEYPDRVVSAEASDDGTVGFTQVWLTDDHARRLHEVVVELVVELMEHAISHTDDDDATAEFESQMLEFDVAAFVDAYRTQREFEDEYDTPA